jgi:hypothetical protein
VSDVQPSVQPSVQPTHFLVLILIQINVYSTMNNSLVFGLTDRSVPPNLNTMKLSRYFEFLLELQDGPEPRLQYHVQSRSTPVGSTPLQSNKITGHFWVSWREKP